MSISLSEINSNNPSAMQGIGNIEAPIDISGAVNAYADYAKEKNRNTLLRYQLYQENLAKFANSHQLDFAGVMKEDIPTIEKQGAKYFAKIKDNPAAINEPNDPDWIALQANIAKSKQDNGYLEAQNKFREMHPDLYDPTNNGIEAQYRSAPLEKRATFSWNLPATIDTQKLADANLASVGEKYADPAVPSEIPGQYLSQTGIRYNKDNYSKNWDDILNSNAKIDQYGHTARDAAQSEFDSLPKPLQSKFEKDNPQDPVAAYWKQRGESYYREQDKDKPTYIEDKNSLEQQKLAQAKDIADKELGLAWWKAKNIDSPKAKAQIDLWKSNTIGGEDQKNAVVAYTKNFMKGLEGLATPLGNGNYIITKDKIPQLTGEQLKYLGQDTPTTHAFGKTTNTGLKPLEISDNSAIMIQPDGKILILEENDNTNGGLPYKLTKEKGTSVNNIMTNRINEELKTAGSKELNAYLSADLSGNDGNTEDETVTVSTTPTKTSESVKVKETQLSNNPSDWKQEGNNWRYKDGTLYDASGKVVKEKK